MEFNPLAPKVVKREVRAKVFEDGRVAVLMIEVIYHEGREWVQKYSLNNEGAWFLLAEGAPYLFLENVFHATVEQ